MDCSTEITSNVKYCNCNTLNYYCYCNGENDVLEKLKNGKIEKPHLTHDSAVLNGHLGVLKWLYSQKTLYQWNNRISTLEAIAASDGHLHILKWIYQQNLSNSCHSSVIGHAAFNGHLKVLKWFYSQNLASIDNRSTHYYAITGGHIKTVKWLYEQLLKKQDNFSIIHDLVVHAGCIGNLTIFKYYIEKSKFLLLWFDYNNIIEMNCLKYLFEINMHKYITNKINLKQLKQFEMIWKF